MFCTLYMTTRALICLCASNTVLPLQILTEMVNLFLWIYTFPINWHKKIVPTKLSALDNWVGEMLTVRKIIQV